MENLSNLTIGVAGASPPVGSITVSGAKNAATKLLAAALVSDEEVFLNNLFI